MIVQTRSDEAEMLERAFTDQVGPLVEPAFRIACALLRDAQAAEDAVQESALIAWRKFRTFDDPNGLRPWFLKIVANECRNAGRRGWRLRVQLGLPANLSVGAVEDGAVRRADLRQALNQLSYRDRLVVVLYYYFDLPLGEIASIAGLSTPAVRNRLYRSVRRLRPDLAVQEALQ